LSPRHERPPPPSPAMNSRVASVIL
jgi:hypothetical protein